MIYCLDQPLYRNFAFSVLNSSSSSSARTSLITTPHGQVETPNFVFCATKAAMKSKEHIILELGQSWIVVVLPADVDGL